MSDGPIDWERPPSRRRRQGPIGRRLVFDVAVCAAAGAIVQVLVGALLDAEGVSERGLRHYMVDAVPGARALAWAVVTVCGLAALFALVDAARAVLGLVRAARGGPGGVP